MNQKLFRFLALACAAICTLCASHKVYAAPVPILFGQNAETTFWRPTSIEGLPAISEDAVVEISIEKMFLSVPCYVSGFAYVFDNNMLDIRNRYQYGSTCSGYPQPPTVAAYEATLGRTKTYRLSGNELVLLDATGKAVITLTRLVAAGIENHRWSIESFFDGTSLVSIANKFRNAPLRVRNNVIPPWMTLMHGQIYGTPGCGGFFGNYSLAGGQLKLEFGSLLTGYCPDTAEELERQVSPALSGDRTIRQNGEQIHLVDADGRVQIVLTPWDMRGFR